MPDKLIKDKYFRPVSKKAEKKQGTSNNITSVFVLIKSTGILPNRTEKCFNTKKKHSTSNYFSFILFLLSY